jgi:hypothetical protein
MRAMTKSAVAVAREALRAGQAALPPYSGPFSRRDFTQAQLLALLVLRQFLRTDYRGVVTLVAEWTELRDALGLTTKVPHYSTLCYAERRVLGKKGGASTASWRNSLGAAARSASSRPGPRSPSTRPGWRRAPPPAPTTPTAGAPAPGATGAAAGRS